MEGILRADTLRIQGHRDITLQERRAAQLLCDQLRHARQMAPPEDAWRFDRLIERSESLSRYFQTMADRMDDMGFELARLSMEINLLLRDTGC